MKCDICDEDCEPEYIICECRKCYLQGLRRELLKKLNKRRRWTRKELMEEFK